MYFGLFTDVCSIFQTGHIPWYLSPIENWRLDGEISSYVKRSLFKMYFLTVLCEIISSFTADDWIRANLCI